MKKIFILISVVFLLIILVYILTTKNIKIEKVIKENKVNIEISENLIDDKIELLLSKMTIEQKIGQMFIIDYFNSFVDENLINLINKYSIGGIILTKANISSYENTKIFVKELQKNSNIPMIISIDQEGGSVQRLQYLNDINTTYIPYMYELGKTNNEQLAYEVGKVIGEELRTIGINVVFAPVLDIFTNSNNTVIGYRSFGENSDVVSKMAISLSKGLEAVGVIPTYKHFPGHGDTNIDSHYNLPIIYKDYQELKNLELIPFKSAIENNAKIIMIGHISLPQITNDNLPASLSKKIISKILKEEMNYNGLVITDALNMGALTNNYSNEEIYKLSIDAGVDLLLIPSDIESAIEYIKNNISEERINDSVRKILNFKYNWLNDGSFFDKEILNSIEHQEIINKIYVQ